MKNKSIRISSALLTTAVTSLVTTIGLNYKINKVVAVPASTTSRSVYTTYMYPKYQGAYLNICYTWGQSCGNHAAKAYCLYKGAGQLSSLEKIGRQDLNAPTKTLGDNRSCGAGGCSGFKRITCVR